MLRICAFATFFLSLTPRTGGFFNYSAAVTAVSWHPYSSVLASVDRVKKCTIWADA